MYAKFFVEEEHVFSIADCPKLNRDDNGPQTVLRRKKDGVEISYFVVNEVFVYNADTDLSWWEYHIRPYEYAAKLEYPIAYDDSDTPSIFDEY